MSRISEKSIELNFCSQAQKSLCSFLVWWQGFTQREERVCGLDVLSNFPFWGAVGFQFKASNVVRRNRANGQFFRRFRGDHDQMMNLVGLTLNNPRLPVFYALPSIGSSQELSGISYNLLGSMYFLDVSQIPPQFPPPVSRSYHHLDLYISPGRSPTCLIHSEPLKLPVLNYQQMVKKVLDVLQKGSELHPKEGQGFLNSESFKLGRAKIYSGFKIMLMGKPGADSTNSQPE